MLEDDDFFDAAMPDLLAKMNKAEKKMLCLFLVHSE